jgi:predicted dehydrogenase/nucleoside-diphosphate-sugar epimerase
MTPTSAPAKPKSKQAIPPAGPVRLFALGGGAVVTHLYLPALPLTQWAQIVGVADPSRQALDALRASGFAGSLVDKGFEQALAVLEQSGDRPDGIVVAMPNAFHEAACLAALDAGFPVLCEKPLALTRQACARIAERSCATGCIVAVGMVRRLLPSVAALRQALQKKLIGDLVRVEVEDGAYYPWLSDTGAYFQPSSGGILADMGVHYLDLLFDLLGELEPGSYRDDWQGGVEANVEYQLHGANNLPVRVRLSRDRTLTNRLVMHGTLGTLSIGKSEFGFARWQPSEGDLEAKLESQQPFNHTAWPKDFTSCFAQQFEEFADAIQGTAPPRCDADQAAHVIGLIEWAYGKRNQRGQDATFFGHPTARGDSPRLPAGKCVVTGASGFVGSRLAARLSANPGSTIVAPVRSYKRVVELARFGAAMPRVSLLDPAAVRDVVQGARYVFHLAYGRDGDDAAKITEQGTRNVVEAAIAAGCEAVVVLSTMSVFGFPGAAAEVDESWPYKPALGEYGRTKMRMEKWCLRKAAESGTTRIVVLNPTNVWGPQGQTYTRLPLEFAAKGIFCWVDGGKGIANLVYVENLIDAILLAATVPQGHGRRFLICDTAMTWREYLTPLLGDLAEGLPDFTSAELARASIRRTGIKDLVRAMSASAEVRSAVKEMPWVGALARHWWRRRQQQEQRGLGHVNGAAPVPAPPGWLHELFGPTTTRFSAAAARRVLQWSPRTDFATGMAETTRWLTALGLRPGDACQP